MAQEEHDGMLPLNVEYRTFQQMYSTLLDAIQAGLSDVVSEVFSKGLISPHTKSVADNTNFAEPARASALMSALLQRTKTCPTTFTQFGDILNSIACFQYLATDMRNNQALLKKKDEEKEREFQKQAKIQEQKRQELQLRISAADTTADLTTGYSYPDSIGSGIAVAADVRKIGNQRSQTPVIVDQKAPIAFQDRRTPSSGTSPLMSVIITPESTKSDLSLISQKMCTGKDVISISTAATASIMPTPSQSAPFEIRAEQPSEPDDSQLSSSAPSKIAISELSVANNAHIVYSKPPLPNKAFQLPEQEKTTVLNVPATVVQAPSPLSSGPPNSPPPMDSEKNDELREAVDKLKVIFPHRTSSIDSLGSNCSHDMPSLTSWLESDSEVDIEQRNQLEHATQELDGDSEEAPLPPRNKMHRSLSCEKCLKKALRKKIQEIEKRDLEEKLEDARAKAALESNNKKLLCETKSLQDEVYALKYALDQRNLERQQLQKHSTNLIETLKQQDGQILQLKDELKEVKADAYDLQAAAKREKLRCHRCPSCNTEFIYNCT